MPEMDDKRLHEEIIGRKEVFRGARRFAKL